MNPIEIFLIIIVTIWTIVFVVFCAGVVFAALKIRKTLKKIDQMLEKAESATGEIGSSIRHVVGGIAALATKNLVTSVAKKVFKLKGRGSK